MQTKDVTGIHIEGHIHIHDPVEKITYVNKRNAIHYENMSIGLAQALANSGQGFIYRMAFGNGGTAIDPTGIITYLTPNTTGTNAGLYSEQYSKVIDPTASENTDPTRNFTEVRHVTGQNYTDIFCSCLLDYGEPNNQDAYETTTGTYVFDELGLKGLTSSTTDKDLLLTHVVFHPVLKSLNRLIQIDYTVRIQSLTGIVGV